MLTSVLGHVLQAVNVAWFMLSNLFVSMSSVSPKPHKQSTIRLIRNIHGFNLRVKQIQIISDLLYTKIMHVGTTVNYVKYLLLHYNLWGWEGSSPFCEITVFLKLESPRCWNILEWLTLSIVLTKTEWRKFLLKSLYSMNEFTEYFDEFTLSSHRILHLKFPNTPKGKRFQAL